MGTDHSSEKEGADKYDITPPLPLHPDASYFVLAAPGGMERREAGSTAGGEGLGSIGKRKHMMHMEGDWSGGQLLESIPLYGSLYSSCREIHPVA